MSGLRNIRCFSVNVFWIRVSRSEGLIFPAATMCIDAKRNVKPELVGGSTGYLHWTGMFFPFQKQKKMKINCESSKKSLDRKVVGGWWWWCVCVCVCGVYVCMCTRIKTAKRIWHHIINLFKISSFYTAIMHHGVHITLQFYKIQR